MRTQMSLRLLVLLDLRSSPTVLSTLLLFALSKPNSSPSKTHTIVRALAYLLRHIQPVYNYTASLLLPTQASRCVLLVEMGGVEPPSRTLFSLLLTAITLYRLNVACLLSLLSHCDFKSYTLTFL